MIPPNDIGVLVQSFKAFLQTEDSSQFHDFTRVTSGLGVLFDQYTLRSIFRVWRLHLFRPDGPSEGRAAWLGGRGVMVIGMVSSFF